MKAIRGCHRTYAKSLFSYFCVILLMLKSSPEGCLGLTSGRRAQ
jgi:hypothetical protein